MNSTPRTPPPPLEANDRLVTGVLTAGWAITLIVLLILRDRLPASERWWVWTSATGFGMGLFGLWYIPLLKHRRAEVAQRRAVRGGASGQGASGAGASGAGASGAGASAAQASRESGSKTVSSTDTPGKSTRS